MILELVVERCASEDAGPTEGVDYEIPQRWERGRNISYKGLKTSFEWWA